MSEISIGPYQDHNRRTLIVVGNNKSTVEFVKLDTTSGLSVLEMSESKFKKDYKPIAGYPLNKAIEQYIEFSMYCGMTKQVKDIFENMLVGLSGKHKVDVSLALSKLDAAKIIDTKPVKIGKSNSKSDDNPPWEDSPSENHKETAKSQTRRARSSERKQTVKEDKESKNTVKEDKKAMPAKRTTKVPAQNTQKNTDGIKVGKPTAAQMFRELILSNSYDDDTIFRMVQKEFGLDDKKRSYVSYYRRELQQKGLL